MDDNDHRAIANRMDLFHQQEEGPGMVFWHPNGFTLYRIIEDFVRQRMKQAGFREIRTPQLLARELWEKSGHWEKFADNMFTFAEDERAHALKPMSCPAHVQVFNKRVRSFRELPLRLAEFGACHRNEPSGALYGLMRTRSFVQDDAHIFCVPDDVEIEVARFCRMLFEIYHEFGFDDVSVAFSTRPDVRAGSDEAWDCAESGLQGAARAAGLTYRTDPGEGAFYGPKLDFSLKDSHGRDWQCGTVQLDMVLPDRLDASFIDSEGHRVRPVMIHHAVLGSIERFIGILLEHYRGDLPLWLAPDQILVANITDASAGYASDVVAELEHAGFRVGVDLRSDRIGKKIVDARAMGIPILAAVGEREETDGTVSLRWLDGRQRVTSVTEAADALRAEAFR